MAISAKGKVGMSAGGLLALNKVDSLTDAHISDSTVTAGGVVTVAADDTSSVDANRPTVGWRFRQ